MRRSQGWLVAAALAHASLALAQEQGSAPVAQAADPLPVIPVPPREEPPPAPDDSPDDSVLAEVIVTAQKRQENLQDVPIAITAVGKELIESNEINSVEDLAELVPALNFSDHNSVQNRNISIRGVGTEVRQTNAEGNVSIVVDGVPLAKTDVATFEFADIERIEVLRGPQGTLFGKNSTSGVLNIVTSNPSSRFEAFARVNYEATQDWDSSLFKTQAGVSGPLTETLGARLSLFYKRVEGHLIDVEQGETPPDSSSRGARAKLRWNPSEALDITLNAESQRINGAPTPLVYRSVNPTKQSNEPDIEYNDRNRKGRTSGLDVETIDNDAISLNVEWDLGPFTLTSTTGYRDFLNFILRSSPNLAGDGVDVIYAGGPRAFKTFTQELRISSKNSDFLEYDVGVLWFANRSAEGGGARVENVPASQVLGNGAASAGVGQLGPALRELLATVGGAAGLPGFLGADVQFFGTTSRTTNLGIFGQTKWHISPAWHLTLGARYINERQRVHSNGSSTTLFESNTGTPLQETIVDPRDGNVSDKHVTGRVSLQHDLTESTNVYGTVSTGYRGGFIEIGREDAEDAINNPIKPETVIAYEIGSKSRVLGGAMEVNLALFHSKFRNFQSLVIDFSQSGFSITPPGEFKVQNAGQLETSGVELDVRTRLSRSLSLFASALYNKAEFKEFISECFPGQQPGENGGRDLNDDGGCDEQDAAGGVLPNAPRISASLSGRYDWNLFEGSHRLYAQVTGRWQDDVQFDARQHPNAIQDAYQIWNLRFGWLGFDGRFEMAATVNNVFNEFYAAGLYGLSLANDRRDVIHFVPASANRQYGVSVAYQW